MRTRILFFFLIFTKFIAVNAQERKTLQPFRTTESIAIDGRLDEQVWSQAAIADGFRQSNRYIGNHASFPTEVKVLYDDRAIYIGAFIAIDDSEKIITELRSRDDLGQSDYFGVMLDPYNDGQNGFCFYVSCRNVQIDYKIDAQGSESYEWDAVWRSGVQIVADGWYTEIMIPYSAIRFSKEPIQNWAINFKRSYQALRETSTWNLVDVEKGAELLQMGELQGLENISPPLRLSLMPYLSAATSNTTPSKSWNNSYNFGLDTKIGLSKSFTLDMTLIPDFGQVESDDKVHSLTPFEVYYDEKRPFFTEGMELFKRGDIFYSRRIGETPEGYNTIQETYEPNAIIDNPDSKQLVNALKVSGKTSKGTGIGVFNAVTANTFAEVKDSTGKKHRIKTAPFTNYNMLVVDQALYKSSYVSIYNTNVFTPDNSYAANVSGTQFRLRDKQDCYGVFGRFNVSQHYTKEKNLVGYDLYALLEKASGKFRGDFWFRYISDRYNPNDMGFLERNNQISNGLNLYYHIYQPQGNILSWTHYFYIKHYYLAENTDFEKLTIGLNSYGTFTNYFFGKFQIEANPFGEYDFFESRVAGHSFYRDPIYWIVHEGSPDYRKKFLVDYMIGIKHSPKIRQFNWWASASPRWRVSNNFLLIPSLFYDLDMNVRGYVGKADETIVFGRRDVKNVELTIDADYSFSHNASISLKLRHYWLFVDYLSYYALQKDGKLNTYNYNGNADFSVNTFNIDLVFKWNFAPGSELVFVYKNAIYSHISDTDLVTTYFENVEQMFQAPISNSFSLKLLYYIDWQSLKKRKV